jgi:hypothetical protein
MKTAAVYPKKLCFGIAKFGEVIFTQGAGRSSTTMTRLNRSEWWKLSGYSSSAIAAGEIFPDAS